MMISTKGRYALRVMLDLAQHDSGEFIALRDISARQGIPVKYLEQIVSALGKSGLLRSMRGNNGGHRLTKRPEEYRIGDILRAVERDLRPVECLMPDGADCPRAEGCLTLPFWRGLEQAVNDYIDRYTLEDLLEQGAARGDDYSI